MDYTDPNATYETTYDTTYDYNGAPEPVDTGISAVMVVLYLAVLVFMLASMWKVFTKAGKPGWASLIPIYNTYVLVTIAGRPGWWFLLYLIPVVNLVVHFIIAVDIAKAFGKSTAFGVFGLGIFSFIGFPMLAFGKDKYRKPKHA